MSEESCEREESCARYRRPAHTARLSRAIGGDACALSFSRSERAFSASRASAWAVACRLVDASCLATAGMPGTARVLLPVAPERAPIAISGGVGIAVARIGVAVAGRA